MSVKIEIQPSTVTTQGTVAPNATASNDGMMTATMVAQLNALWDAMDLPDARNGALVARLPASAAQQTIVLPNASTVTNGVMTATQVQQLTELWAASGLPMPVVGARADLPFVVRFSPDRTVSQQVIIPAATQRNVGAMTSRQFQQLSFLWNNQATYMTNLSSAPDSVIGAWDPLATPLGTIQLVWIKPEITRVKVFYGNRVMCNESSILPQLPGPTPGCTAAVGPAALDGQSWTSSPVEINDIELPANGGLFYSDWIDVTGMRNANGEIGLYWNFPEGNAFQSEYPGSFGYSAPNNQVDPLAGLVQNGVNPMFVGILYEDEGINFSGDSLTRGLSSTSGDNFPPYQQTYGYLVGSQRGISACRAATSGASLQSWADIATFPEYWDWLTIRGNKQAFFAGTNDINAGRTAAQMLADLETCCVRSQQRGSLERWAWTVPPSATFSPAQNAQIVIYNTTLLTLPFGLSYVLDAHDVLKNLLDPEALDPAFDAGDQIHLNAAGDAALLQRMIDDGKV